MCIHARIPFFLLLLLLPLCLSHSPVDQDVTPLAQPLDVLERSDTTLDGGDRNALALGIIVESELADVSIVHQNFDECRFAGVAQNRSFARQI